MKIQMMSLNAGTNAEMMVNAPGSLLMKTITFASCIQHAMTWISPHAILAPLERKHVDPGRVR